MAGGQSGSSSQGATAPGLRRGAIGLREVLFQSITAMAPGAAIAASIPAGAAFAGGGLPLAVLVALVASLFTAFAIGELARHLPAAGSVATYTAQGLHPAVGFLVGWGYVFVEALVPPLLFLQLGFTTAATLNQEFGGFPANLWWPWFVVGALIVAVAGYLGIRASAELGTVLGIFEVAVFVVLGALFIVAAGRSNTLSVFSSAYTPTDYQGLTGIIAGSVYTILAFSGFEAAAPLAEEAVNPKRNVRRAVVGSTLLIGAVYVFTTYAVTVLFGPDKFSTFQASGANSWQGLARHYYGWFWILVFLAIVNSTIANANAGSNASTRTAYALGRIHVFPRAFATLHPRYRSPYLAVGVQLVVALVVGLGLGLLYGPVTAFLLIATVLVLVIVSVYILCDLACIGFFWRRRREDFRPLRHVVVPLLGVLTFLPGLLTAAGIPVFPFIATLAPPVSYAGPTVLVWLLAGVGYLLWLRRRAPARVAAMSQVHLVDELDAHEKAVAS